MPTDPKKFGVRNLIAYARQEMSRGIPRRYALEIATRRAQIAASEFGPIICQPSYSQRYGEEA